jgi:hypothetical protein
VIGAEVVFCSSGMSFKSFSVFSYNICTFYSDLSALSPLSSSEKVSATSIVVEDLFSPSSMVKLDV